MPAMKPIIDKKAPDGFCLLQEAIALRYGGVEGLWRQAAYEHFVVCIMLNRARGKIARQAFPIFLGTFHDHNVVRKLEENSVDFERGSAIMRPLGLQRSRMIRIRNMAASLHIWSGEGDPSEHLDGVGEYAASSYNIFFRGDLSEEPSDGQLAAYVRRMRG